MVFFIKLLICIYTDIGEPLPAQEWQSSSLDLMLWCNTVSSSSCTPSQIFLLIKDFIITQIISCWGQFTHISILWDLFFGLMCLQGFRLLLLKWSNVTGKVKTTHISSGTMILYTQIFFMMLMTWDTLTSVTPMPR